MLACLWKCVCSLIQVRIIEPKLQSPKTGIQDSPKNSVYTGAHSLPTTLLFVITNMLLLSNDFLAPQGLSANYRAVKKSGCCMMSCFVDGHGPVSVSIWGYDLLWLFGWNSASLQLCWPVLCLHAATAAPPWLWHLGHHYGQVRKSLEVTQPFLGSDPQQDQVVSIYSVSCLK